jgi:hypothetical protein
VSPRQRAEEFKAQAPEGVKKSRLCRLMCGKARPFRPPGSTAQD